MTPKIPAEPAAPVDEYLLRLYVAGTTQQSTRAILNIQQICEEHLGGRYHLEVIDIYQRPQLAKDEQIVAVPTLVKKLPAPPQSATFFTFLPKSGVCLITESPNTVLICDRNKVSSVGSGSSPTRPLPTCRYSLARATTSYATSS